jgi:tRNA A-37 threonylcarbamoyl transferase component Bud32
MLEQCPADSCGSSGPEDPERLIDRFEVAWQGGAVPAIGAFLPPERPGDGARRRELVQELVKIDLEYRWRRPNPDPAGCGSWPARPRLEDYVRRFPDLGPAERLPVGLIGEEYRVRQRWGDRPAHAEYARRFPRHGPAVPSLLTRIDAELASETARTGPAPRRTDTPMSLAGPVRLRCPHCRHEVEADGDALPRDLACPACGDTFRVEPLPAAAGRTARPPSPRVGRYELGELLGTGAFGSVWRGRDAELAREVAVKLPRGGGLADPAEEERFLREARAAAQLHHPGIVEVYDVGRDDETPYIVSELVRGVTLARRLREGRLSFRESAALIAQVADALDYAHRQGVVHRDLKPANILLEMGNEKTEDHSLPIPITPKITDFGLALRDAAEVTMTLDGQVLGTPAYMSPEQIRNPHAVDGRSDVYSLGVILYQLLTGELPFRGVARMLLVQVVSDEPRPPRRLNDAIPRDLETVCLKCLVKEPGRRYRTAAALAADLRRWLAGAPVLARPPGRVERLWLGVKSHPALAVTVGLLTVALVTVSGAPLAAALVAVTTGSLLFALHQSKVSAEQAQEVEGIRQSQQKAAAALQFSLQRYRRDRQERDRAAAAQAQAERRFARVRELARTLIFDFPDTIPDPPGPAPARALLVRTALAYLDSLAPEAGADAALRRELAVAYARVADVQGNPAVANLGDAAGALDSQGKSLELFAALAQAHPENAQARRDLAVGHAKLGDLQRALGRPGEALVSYRKSRAVREALARARPNDAEGARELARSYARLGALHAQLGSDPAAPRELRLGHWRQARVWHQRALDTLLAVPGGGALSESDPGAPDRLAAAVARCEAAITGLEAVDLRRA